ncbi:MAG TPA: tetratricopeptide repeat protein [Pyrinomonadaceae bacterium]|jgi:tetratricopeptide (TPR) repeat protein
MKFTRFSLIFTFFLFTFAFSVFAQSDTISSRTWQVQKYDITATLPQAETDRYLTVKAVLNLKNVSPGAASSLTLRISDKAEISAVKINGNAADFRKSEEKVSGSLSLQRANFILPSTQPGQTVSVEVNYKLKTDENSGLSAISPAGSQFLPLSFWYPTPNSWYFARGADFAPVSMQINYLNGESAVSSGKIGTDFESAKSLTLTAYEQKLNVQPFFVTGNWDKVSANGATVYLPKGAGADEQKRANELASLASEAKSFVGTLLGAAPDASLQIVSVKRGAGFSSGGTILIDEGTFRRQKIDSQTAMTVAESIAKMWIGNAAQIDGDGYGAISEGLPRFIATQFIEQKYGRDMADIERLRQRSAYSAVVKRDSPLSVVSPLDDYHYSVTANKGAMVWRLLAKKIGQEEFLNVLRAAIKDGNLNLNELREAFPSQKDFLDYALGQVTDTNLLIGLPQQNGAETKIALRNTGSIDATVNILATTVGGDKLTAQATIPAKSFGEVTFKNPSKIVRAEIDSDKFYPQTDYSDDVAPREFTESDPLLAIKRSFDKQDFAGAEKNALAILKTMPHFDDARIFLARALLAEGKTADAEKEFRAVLEEKLPTSRSLAWANVGLGEINLKAGQKTQAATFFEEAVKADAEYGATLAARQGRNNAGSAAAIDESIKAFFAQFDKAAISGRKSDIDAMIVTGEIPRFSTGIGGQAQQWETKILQVDKYDGDGALVEANMNIKLLNKNEESGVAIFRLAKIGGVWKLSGVEMFEVR